MILLSASKIEDWSLSAVLSKVIPPRDCVIMTLLLVGREILWTKHTVMSELEALKVQTILFETI